MNKINTSNLLCDRSREVNNPQKGLVIGNRIPKDYFITKGTGESDITIHAGSYHLALKNAGIERANIMTYSSILPSIANLVDQPESFTHGAVMETIMAVAHGSKNERVSAGIIYGWLYDRITGEKFGGLVCEHNGNYKVPVLEEMLRASLDELYYNGFEEDYSMGKITLLRESFIPRKKYGTVLVALCLTNYFYPILQ